MRRSWIIGSAALLAGGVAALATTFVPMSDGALADRAEAIATVRVLSVAASPEGIAPSTDYLVEVESLLGGYLPGTTVVLRVLGGQRPDGSGLVIWGAPRFEVGDRALLMLEGHDDGAFRLTQFLLGAFVQAEAGDGRWAIRDLRAASSASGSPGTLEVRDWDRFESWIRDRRAGILRSADYLGEIGSLDIEDNLTGQFTLLGTDLNLRWFEFDVGEDVPFHAHSAGQPGIPGGGFEIFQRAIDAWNLDPGSDVRYRYAGKTRANGGLYRIDGYNTLLFNDPQGDLGGPFDCHGGGIVAIGGPWIGSAIQTFRGQRYRVITGADIVTNANLGCFFASSSDPETAAEELYGHNLGHTLGLAHSCGDSKSPPCAGALDEALMRTTLHDDGRGALLGSDDRAGIASLYPANAPCYPPPNPIGLNAFPRSATTLEVHWEAGNDPSFEILIEVAAGGTALFAPAQIGESGEGWAEIVDLEPSTEYRVRLATRVGDDCLSDFLETVTWTPSSDLEAPRAPVGLMAVRHSSGPFDTVAVWLTWQDRSDNELAFEIERRNVTADSNESYQWIASPPIDGTTTTPGVMVFGQHEGETYEYRVRARGVAGYSDFSAAETLSVPAHGTACSPGPSTACLLAERFQIDVQWRNQHDFQAPGRPIEVADLGDRTTSFSFFRNGAVDLIVKVLDGVSISGHYWVFYGALSDVEYWITVTDTSSGETTSYHNPPGEICGSGDTGAIGGQFAATSVAAPPALPAIPSTTASITSACEADETTLCLLGGRFRVQVQWTDELGSQGTGAGRTIPDTDESGFFWFFQPDNTELAVKMLDGRGVNGNFWFFYGALSDVAYEITVTDTLDGSSTMYSNAQGNLCGRGDTGAF